MTDNFFFLLENADTGSSHTLADTLSALRFNEQGLLPVVTQCATSKRVLMMAWMNADALTQTLRDGEMVYFSRRRQMLWRKGETSGCTQRLQALFVDCDGDTLLAQVEQTGPACHTRRPSCFYLRLTANSLTLQKNALTE
ncbi:phosphoribosyl-AMP cyclohydrolase [Candidatus Persebacteraceae bacterium Df01]|jgi:phosphoribosyl-AMP cyclohydrolase|uniref:phosphoribosyl-AMP cyclohydrolase n=1 Tax=Candidatus Doriopsillibacter californiensis TaxID=2970740 RepID=A0ABT7QLJ6_9GAMM|nr:phosphoribosyl-AMP cyclohydrolase [Candidatus Persebacteraceae bacterium Df01]